MVFSSFEFFLFFPIVTFLYFTIPHKYRWLLLLISSCVFYAFFKWEYILILFFTIVIDYFAAIWIDKSQGKERKWALAISLIANIGVLALFKYYYFLIDNLNSVTFRINGTTYQPLWHFILPIGLSFHTFQAMSYTIEVYRGHQKVERNFGIYALYVMFYPQLVAGPIERPQNILHQFYEKFEFDQSRVVSGLRLMLWGFFKKMVVADNFATYSDTVFNNVHQYQGLPLIVAILFYSVQIYCDFSGYSDIAIGSARVMGFKLMTNFKRPYFSKSIAEFWKRWHISLSTWFRDYLYIPLGGSRVAIPRYYLNIFIVFMVSGLWHGASWNFVIWGALHGLYQIVGHFTKDFQQKIFQPLGKLGGILENWITVALAVFAWIFFRAATFKDAKYFATHLFSESTHSLNEIIQIITPNNLVTLAVGFCILYFVDRKQEQTNVGVWVDTLPKWQRWGIYYFFTFAILTFGYFGAVQFIYFQF
jgi:alginate O-acetyltransferase complex protein AlgI